MCSPMTITADNKKTPPLFPTPTPFGYLPLAKLLAFVVQLQTSLHCTHLLATFLFKKRQSFNRAEQLSLFAKEGRATKLRREFEKPHTVPAQHPRGQTTAPLSQRGASVAEGVRTCRRHRRGGVFPPCNRGHPTTVPVQKPRTKNCPSFGRGTSAAEGVRKTTHRARPK